MQVPKLPHSCNSWIVIPHDGQAFETYNSKLIEKLNPEKCVVQDAMSYLAGLNVKRIG